MIFGSINIIVFIFTAFYKPVYIFYYWWPVKHIHASAEFPSRKRKKCWILKIFFFLTDSTAAESKFEVLQIQYMIHNSALKNYSFVTTLVKIVPIFRVMCLKESKVLKDKMIYNNISGNFSKLMFS